MDRTPRGSDARLPTGAAIVAFHESCFGRAGWPADETAVAAAVESATRSAGGSADPATGDRPAPDAPAGMLWQWIATNHRYNCLLWAEEDLARRTRVSDSDIAANKRNIDGFNQARNDATERVDELLLVALGLVDRESAANDAPVSTPGPGARLNSETAGSMIDRLSILALKVHAMDLQTRRTDVDDAHREASKARLERLRMQRDDLAGCYDRLIEDCRAGRAYFKVYRQFKMYNDPRFNPALVAEATKGMKETKGTRA
ncbi:MAG: DUF4254 domain-containing protein [Burkholderiaceae bacterium]|nr:DUF4254 domain-containing protein [Burkholderiaceae bacterium]